MANEFRKVTDQNGVDHPVTDDTRVTWTANGVLGAKNICCITGVADKSSNTDVTWSANSARIKSDVAAQYINANLNIKSLPKNKTVKISFDATITAGDGIAIVKGKPSGGSYATLLNQSVGSSSSYEVEFNTGSNDDFQLNLYVSKGEASAGDITYNNIMISFDGGEFAPYAMPNRELTEKVNVLDPYRSRIESAEGVREKTITLNYGYDSLIVIAVASGIRRVYLVTQMGNNSTEFDTIMSAGTTGTDVTITHLTDKTFKMSVPSWWLVTIISADPFTVS